MRVVLLAALLAAPLLAGCTADSDPVLRLAFTQPDDALEPAKHPQRLADAIQAATGRETRVYFVQSTELALQAVHSGQADAAFVDGAAGWFAWQRFGLDAVAATLESDGRTYYVASAYVLANSTYQSMADLRGADSCHTGLLKSAGTFMPLGWLIREGLAARIGPDEITSIVPTLDEYFGTVHMPPSDADPYGNYQGALRCLSEGKGDVSFGKDTTPATFCAANVTPRAAWCLDLAEYREVARFGRVASHPVMANPDLAADKRADLVAGLVALTSTTEGKAILKSVLNSNGMVPVDGSRAHLGEFGANVQHVPGMSKYVEGQIRA
jgi:ABC-type phosphate/phosphonate transport system substrate-binding protein